MAKNILLVAATAAPLPATKAKKLGVEFNKTPRKPLHFLIWAPSREQIAEGYVEFTLDGKPNFKINWPKKIYY